jgi:DNA repair protein RAD16
MDRSKVNDSRLTSSKDSASSIANSNDSSDYDTPGTSRVVTPAETNDAKRPSRITATKFGSGPRTLALRSPINPRSSSKRRRVTYVDSEEDDDDDDDDEDADTKLARRLQEEEYGAEPSSKKPKLQRLAPKGHSAPHIIQNSDPLDISDSEDDVPLVNIRRRTTPKYESEDDLPNTPCESFGSARGDRRRQAASVSASKLSNILKLDDDDDNDSSALASVTDTDQSSNFDDDDDESVITSNASLADDVAGLNNGQSASPTRAARPVRAPVVRRGRRAGERGEWGNNRARRERAKLVKTHPEIITMWDDLKAKDPIIPDRAEQPASINRQLKSFQLEGLDWMIRQEQSDFKGGLLGDEMGMGKTIQAVSLIMSDYPAKQPTLVVVPPVALMQWQAEINSYTSGKLKVLIYHITSNPKCKLMTMKDLKKFNVIMVSYSSLESMYRKENKGWNRADGIVKEDSILHALNFHRIILDEAHSIKQRTTGVAKACFALKGTYKWCLSGTPVQNRIGEFFSLLRFLEVVPFACYFCKQCKCTELHWSQNEKKMCAHCNHSGFNHVSVFNQEILNPITSGETKLARQVGFDKLRLITDRIMLRRMKRDYTSSMELPPKDVIVHNEFFGEIERDFSQSIMSNTQRKFDTYVAQGVMLNNYANIFGLIMQMRQVANHPDLILRRNAEGGQNVLVCCICDEPAEEAIRSACKHEFCRQCAKNFVQSFDDAAGEADCPRCHIPLSIDWDQADIEQDEEKVKKSSIINRIKMEDWTSSTKIEMLVYDLYKLRSKKQTHKSIVFSQFTSMLQLVQWRLQKSGFSTVLLDGSMTPAQRQKSIEYFMTNVDVEVFLVSLKAGGVALNLTEASRVFIIDP